MLPLGEIKPIIKMLQAEIAALQQRLLLMGQQVQPSDQMPKLPAPERQPCSSA